MRYNIFYQIHKGLRAMLYDTATRLQHVDLWDTGETNEIIERITEVINFFDSHAHSEDTYVFPAVEKYDPAIADAFEQEHVEDHRLGKELDDAINGWRSARVIDEKAQAARQVNIAFIKFMVFNLEHMAKEEDILNKILWRYYTDEELGGITQQIVSRLSPEHVQKGNTWMMRGLSNPEITRWLKIVERTAPEPVFQSLFAIAERELPEKRFRQVLEGLTEGVMLA